MPSPRGGADGLELDLQLTADDERVVHHDAHLAGRPLRELTVIQFRERALREALARRTGAAKRRTWVSSFDPHALVRLKRLWIDVPHE